MSQEVVDMIPAASARKNDYDVSAAVPAWVALMKEPGSNSYGLRYFALEGKMEEVLQLFQRLNILRKN